MADKIQQARRAAFESAVARYWDERLAHFDRDGDGCVFGDMDAAWWAFNAALDCVVIELPTCSASMFVTSREAIAAQAGVVMCADAIESTSLGIKVK